MPNPLQDALAIVQKMRADLKATLSDPKHINNMLVFNGWIDKMESKLIFMGALGPQVTGVSVKTEQRFPPMTSMMGRPITGRASLDSERAKEVLTREEQQEQAFLKAVDKLWGTIGKLSPQSVLTNYGRSQNEIYILRGVAKKAKVNYKQDLTIQFVQEIQTAIKTAMDETAKQKIIDKSVNPTIKGDQKPRPVGSFIITEERMAEEPAWAAIGAEVGDLVSANNKKFKIIAKGVAGIDSPDITTDDDAQDQ